MFVLNRIGRVIVPSTVIAVSISSALAQSNLPSDPNVVVGDIGFTLPSAGTLNINQTSAAGVINWGSFSIGNGNTVSFQNGSGATLNRVTGSEASQILGNLNATGSVFLLNQNGVFIGKDGVIQTGGDFVASTLDVSNTDFLDSGDTLFEGSSGANVLNFGKIGSLGGNVALIARTVVNEGSISAPDGTAALVAGREVLMRDIALDNGMFVVRVGGEDTSVTDRGSITAATAELRANGGNIYALAGNTKGSIRATGVQKRGGRVFLTAGGGTIKTTKTVSARKANGSGGRIIVNAGHIEASNLYDVSASSGKGGFVELFATAEAAFSGTILAYGDSVPGMGGFAEVSGVEKLTFTGIADTGGGTLLLDPNNIEITSDAVSLSGATIFDPLDIQNNLSFGSVIIQTSGTDGEAGTIAISESIDYSSSFDLTFLAHGDIVVGASVFNRGGTGDINLVAGWDGSTSTATFDPNVFDAADLANPGIFGNSSGGAYTLNGVTTNASGQTRFLPQFSDLFVGSLNGDTRVYTGDLDLTATEDSGFAFGAMLGVRVENFVFDGSSAITGNIAVRASGDIALNGANQEGGFAQIGHVGSAVGASGGENTANASGDINIEVAGDVTLDAGEADGAYSMIGHGSVDTCAPATCTQSAGTRQGEITVVAGGEISLDDGLNSFGETPIPILAWIGHGTGTANGISNADVGLFAAAFDQNAFTSISSGSLGRIDPNIITAALAGGDVGIAATDTGLQFLNGDTISATNGTLAIHAENNLQFGSSFEIADTGPDGEYLLSTNEDFFNVSGEDLFNIGTGKWVVYSTSPVNNTGDLNSIGGLRPNSIVYGQTLGINDPNFAVDTTLAALAAVGASQNVLVYSIDPVLTVDPVSFTYGQDATAAPTFQFTVAGDTRDPADFGFDTIDIIPDSSVVTFSPGGFANAGTYSDGMIAQTSGVNGSNIIGGSGFDGASDLTVTPATLNVLLADETKEGTGYTGNVSYVGFVSGDSETLITSGPSFYYTGGDGSDGVNPGTYTVSGFGSTESSGNYIFEESDTASLTIEAGTVTPPVTDPDPDPDPDPQPTEEPTADLPELPRDLNPSTTANQVLALPVLIDGTDGSDGSGFIEVSAVNTDQIVNQLQRGKQFCEGLAQSEYVIDCMGDSLQKAADGLPEGGDYAAVRAALEEASAKLSALARQNASATLTRGLVQANGQQSSRRFTPVASEALATLNAQAAAIIDEAQTILLRSAQNSDRRKVHYQRIAEAVGSNKILLRS